MTLSQIIAKDSYYDEEIPDKGKYKVFLVIQDGRVELADITKQKAKEVCARERERMQWR